MIRAATAKDLEEFENQTNFCVSRRAKGIVNEIDGHIAAMVAYDYWTHSSVQVHVFSTKLRHFVEPVFLREIFSYPFITCGRNLLVAVTPGDCKGSLAVSDWLGFRETGRIKNGWSEGIDMIIKELNRADCRWLQQKAA